MKLLSVLLVSCTLFAGSSLATRYTERTFRIEATSSLEMATTDIHMERDGEPVETGMGGERSSRDVRKVVYIDKVVETTDGVPVHVERTFETLEGSVEMTFGDESRQRDFETPLSGAKLDLTRGEDGEVRVEVVEGEDPEDESVLDSMHLTLALEELLPDDDVDAGDTWELDGEAIVRALGLLDGRALFTPPAPDDDEGDGRRRRMGDGGGTFGLLREAEWSGKATLEEGETDLDGKACVVIRFELEAQAEVPDMPFGGGRRGPRAWSAATPVVALAGSLEVDLEGKLYFAQDEALPVRLEIEGSVSEERTFERSRGESTFSGSMTRSGTFEHTVDVSLE